MDISQEGIHTLAARARHFAVASLLLISLAQGYLRRQAHWLYENIGHRRDSFCSSRRRRSRSDGMKHPYLTFPTAISNQFNDSAIPPSAGEVDNCRANWWICIQRFQGGLFLQYIYKWRTKSKSVKGFPLNSTIWQNYSLKRNPLHNGCFFLHWLRIAPLATYLFILT